MRIGGWDYLDLNSTDGIALTVYFQGCSRGCKGCHNPSLQPSIGDSKYYTAFSLAQEIISKCDEGEYDYVVLLGGEPLEQNHADLLILLTILTGYGIKVWLYTGWEYRNVPDWAKTYCYCIKAGAYDPVNYPPKEGSKLASSNQAYYFANGRVEQ